MKPAPTPIPRSARPPHHRRAVLLPLAVLFASAACEAEPGATNALPNVDTLPILEVEEVLRIGSLEDPDYGFSQITAIDVDAEGNLFVAEGRDLEIRVYNPTGELSRRIGRAGEGPGEFGQIGRMGLSGDTLWVVDHRQGRILTFSTSGEVLSTARYAGATAPLHLPGQQLIYLPRLRDTEGHFVSDGGLTMAGQGSGPERDSVDVPIIRFGIQGEVVDTAGWLPQVHAGALEWISVGQSTFMVPSLPHTRTRRVLTPWGLVIVEQEVEGSTPRVRVLRTTHGGDTVRLQDFAFVPLPFPEGVLESIAVSAAHVTGQMIAFVDGQFGAVQRHEADTARARERILEAMEVPAAQPAVQGIHPAADGSLWLERERTDETLRRWTILDASDEPVGELHLPRDHRLLRVESDMFWLQERDEFDVPWIVQYRWFAG